MASWTTRFALRKEEDWRRGLDQAHAVALTNVLPSIVVEDAVQNVTSDPIHAVSRRNIPPRISRITAADTLAAFATASMIKCIFGRPTARCVRG